MVVLKESLREISELEFIRMTKGIKLEKNDIFFYNKKTNIVEISFNGFWEEYQEIFNLSYEETALYFKMYIERYFNLKDIKVKIKDENITHKIRTLNDAINSLDKNDEVIITYKNIKDLNIPEHIKSYLELVIITKVLNEGWVPDWNNHNERKWCSYWKLEPSTSRFVFDDAICGCWDSFTFGCSRLCFREESLAAFAANRFPQIYNNYLIYNK